MIFFLIFLLLFLGFTLATTASFAGKRLPLIHCIYHFFFHLFPGSKSSMNLLLRTLPQLWAKLQSKLRQRGRLSKFAILLRKRGKGRNKIMFANRTMKVKLKKSWQLQHRRRRRRRTRRGRSGWQFAGVARRARAAAAAAALNRTLNGRPPLDQGELYDNNNSSSGLIASLAASSEGTRVLHPMDTRQVIASLKRWYVLATLVGSTRFRWAVVILPVFMFFKRSMRISVTYCCT